MRALFSKSWLKASLILMGLPPALAHATETHHTGDVSTNALVRISLNPSPAIGEGTLEALEVSPNL